MDWTIAGIYTASLIAFAVVDVRKRRRAERDLRAEYQKDVDEAHADYTKSLEEMKALHKKRVDAAFADGATVGCRAIVDALKRMGLLDSGFEVEIAAIAESAMEKVKSESDSQDDAFLRSLKIKP